MTTIAGLPAELTAPVYDDLIVVRDISDATNKDKKMELDALKTLFVALVDAQTIGGAKTFSNGITTTTLTTSGAAALNSLSVGGNALTVPAAGTAALLGTAQTFSALKTFSAGLSFGVSTLSNYDEGTGVSWTVTLSAQTGSISTGYSVRTQRYTRDGNMVNFVFYVRTSAYSAGSGTGEIWINLPFTASSTNQNVVAVPLACNGVTFPGTPMGVGAEVVAGTNVIRLYSIQNGGARQYVAPSGLAAVTDISCAGFYFI